MILEVKNQADTTGKFAAGNAVALVTPNINEDYWLFRVKVSEKQAVVGFPKFSTIGIGFQHEEDWNTNLPYTSDAAEIYNHIKHNKIDAKKADCIKAIKMIQEAAKTYKGEKHE